MTAAPPPYPFDVRVTQYGRRPVVSEHKRPNGEHGHKDRLPAADRDTTQSAVLGNRPLSSFRRRPYQPHTQSFLSTGGLSVVPIEHKMGSKKILCILF